MVNIYVEIIHGRLNIWKNKLNWESRLVCGLRSKYIFVYIF